MAALESSLVFEGHRILAVAEEPVSHSIAPGLAEVAHRSPAGKGKRRLAVGIAEELAGFACWDRWGRFARPDPEHGTWSNPTCCRTNLIASEAHSELSGARRELGRKLAGGEGGHLSRI